MQGIAVIFHSFRTDTAIAGQAVCELPELRVHQLKETTSFVMPEEGTKFTGYHRDGFRGQVGAQVLNHALKTLTVTLRVLAPDGIAFALVPQDAPEMSCGQR